MTLIKDLSPIPDLVSRAVAGPEWKTAEAFPPASG